MTTAEFKEIWVPLTERLYRVAYYILENQSGAEDAVQDLMVRLWNMRSTLGGIKNPAAFGITVIRNICLDKIRSSSLAKRDIKAKDTLDEVQDNSDGIDTILIRKENLERIKQCLARLPDKQRKVLEMKVFDNKSYPEIALLTGLSETNVRVKLSNARKNLKKMIADEDNR